MRDYLVLTLAAPFASFGTIAVGERRPSSDHPTKSQVIGLVAASLGVERTEEKRQQELAASLGYAVRMDNVGRPASDYHTAEAADEASARRWRKANGPMRTRRDELACDKRKTILSMREYRTGVHATIVLWLKQTDFTTLDDIKASLAEPRFTLFAGRKAFPLMLPCRPVIITGAACIEDALDQYDEGRTDAVRTLEATLTFGQRRAFPSRPLYADSDAVLRSNAQRFETRRDMPETRSKWGFGLRDEIALALPTTTMGDDA
ncbi:CRISPR-associated protein, Cas5e family [Hyphomicrobium sulfonivorans]|uniref:CRISPR-associated protein, Cas5e family n=1 Tax=Hyphomicrobium sulfonivorans TaxID=121290 RepID=A0A109BPV5_HYPSL|nr:type I-E CRISPR-associated protein Cas5/CasD [Hyphomicrobium sulfonivorans]KWT72784.1 CRISPR-associated protein, Cas5e family [Hyphomicrobium sulfonivorans]